MQTVGVVLGALVALALGGWLIWRLSIELRTGVANAAGTLHRRATDPIKYWVTICAQCVFAVACAVVLLRIMERMAQ